MDAQEGLHSWQQILGQQIREARKRARFTQDALAKAVGKTRNSIIEYEAGRDAPTVNTLASIALQLGMTEVNINGFRFSVRPRADSQVPDSAEQLRLDLDKEFVLPGATLKITPTKLTITITATAPAPPVPAQHQGEAPPKASSAS